MLIKLFEICLYSLLGGLMFASKLFMEILPNIHLLTMLTIVYTVVLRVKAIFPIYLFVLLTGIYAGFAPWWIPYLYIWLFPYLLTLLLPKNIPKKLAIVAYIVICGLHGFLYGVLYAPSQALLFGLDFKATCAWIIAGLPWDFIHGVSNCITATLVLPLATPLKRIYNEFKNRIR